MEKGGTSKEKCIVGYNWTGLRSEYDKDLEKVSSDQSVSYSSVMTTFTK
jgi:hypothetical protein